ncbi:putative ribonucleoside-thiphosphate reductase [Rhizobium phage vB_RleS_L338C]|uniref:putative ribonucleoside-thiphosphate reductase n=1 Tax=Rhizobium phage vB_RleS_L338C TaxID=1414737 RepID=UPI0003D879C9|nr:putative ribonucleoside-thiphosphate reductase [Rhizobium phage vB_RleS_L338C]AHC30494.1 putative ribonucleoside-thiphosphate reductase [Rhizobium phage vB_RleS_L338C]
MSGRHLQHGDENQPTRNMEVFTNCSTAATTFLLFYLLLNGSGVGRSYDDAMIKADLNFMPIVVPTIEWSHPDAASGAVTGFLTKRDAEHLYAGRKITVFNVPDDREGWAKAIEKIEVMARQKRREEVLILEFSGVREKVARSWACRSPGFRSRPADVRHRQHRQAS